MSIQEISIRKKNIAKSFSKAAGGYEKSAFFHKEIADRLLERLELMNSKPLSILDAGCGTGYCTRALKKRFPKANVSAIDIAEGMVEQAKKNQSLFRKNNFQVADMEDLPFSTNSFDLVFSNLAILWLENPEISLKEMNRVLKPGGLIIFSTLGPDTLIELRESWQKVDKNKHINHFIDMHLIGDAVHKSGYENTVMDRDVITLTYQTMKGLMRDIKLIGAHYIDDDRAKGLLGRSQFQQLEGAYEEYRWEDGQLPATCEVIYGHAWKKVDIPEDYHTYRVDVS